MVYIDPGSGSMAFQLLIASSLGLILTFWKRLRKALDRLLGRRH